MSRAGVVCAAAAKDCAAAGRVREDWQVDWGLRLLVDYTGELYDVWGRHVR